MFWFSVQPKSIRFLSTLQSCFNYPTYFFIHVLGFNKQPSNFKLISGPCPSHPIRSILSPAILQRMAIVGRESLRKSKGAPGNYPATAYAPPINPHPHYVQPYCSYTTQRLDRRLPPSHTAIHGQRAANTNVSNAFKLYTCAHRQEDMNTSRPH